jgi:hypothetical protein
MLRGHPPGTAGYAENHDNIWELKIFQISPEDVLSGSPNSSLQIRFKRQNEYIEYWVLLHPWVFFCGVSFMVVSNIILLLHIN